MQAHAYHTDPRSTGKERDQESGNDYMFARYYNSATGRFLSPDWDAKSSDPVPYAKLDNPQSLNLYSYVGNNPMGKADPDGHDAADALKLEGILEMACPECTPIVAAAAIVTVGVIAVKAYEEHQSAAPAAPAAPASTPTPAPAAPVGASTPPASQSGPRTIKVSPDGRAEGPHSVPKPPSAGGPKAGYTEYDADGNPVKRYRGEGKPHGGVKPPLVVEPKPGKGPGSKPIVPRPAKPEEIPQ